MDAFTPKKRKLFAREPKKPTAEIALTAAWGPLPCDATLRPPVPLTYGGKPVLAGGFGEVSPPKARFREVPKAVSPSRVSTQGKQVQSAGARDTVVAPKRGAVNEFLDKEPPPHMPYSIQRKWAWEGFWLTAHGAGKEDLRAVKVPPRMRATRLRKKGFGKFSADCSNVGKGQRVPDELSDTPRVIDTGDHVPASAANKRPPNAAIRNPADDVRVFRR